MGIKAVTLVAGFIALSASSAFAWGDMYMGDGTNNPNSGTIFPYNAKANYCPQGLQPVMMNGVICCGTPNTAQHFYNAPGGKKRVTRKKTYSPRAYAPVGTKGVVYN